VNEFLSLPSPYYLVPVYASTDLEEPSKFHEVVFSDQERKRIYRYPLPLDGINMASHKRKDVANRVAKIHGHVHAVKEMLDDGRSYSEVVHQIVAIRSALDSAIQVIVDDLVEDCVAKAERKESMKDSLVELQQIVAKIR